MSKVAAVRGSELGSMAIEGLDLLGGIEKVIKPGDIVFIKPNLVHVGIPTEEVTDATKIFKSGECSKTEIVIAVAEACLKAGANEVIIGDGAHVPSYSWESVVTLDGFTNLATEARRMISTYNRKVTLACLEADSPGWVDIISGSSLGKIAVSNLALGADRVISIPVIKTHSSTGISLSLKNFVGVSSFTRHGNSLHVRSALHQSSGGIHQCIVDIVAALKPCLTVIDCSIGAEGDFPRMVKNLRKTVDMRERLGSWLILASPDLVAADATVARMIGEDVNNIKHLILAHELGLGEINENRIEILGDTLENLKVKWQLASPMGI